MTGLREPRIFHVNVNCSDLDAALAFYRDAVGLAPLVRTTPEPQPGALFGLDTVQWDGWILTGAAGIDEVVLDLLEWKIPPPTGDAAAAPFRALRLAVTNGSNVGPGATADPDGTPVDVVSGHGARFAGVSIGCADVARSRSFYTEVIGLASVGEAALSDSRGSDVFRIDLVDGAGASRAAHEVGPYRLAFLTDDIDRDHAELLRAGIVPYSPPVSVDLGPGLPAVRAVCFADPDGATLELIEQPS